MNSTEQDRFDVDALREICGGKVFARGEEYHRAGLVEILSLKPGRVLAQVEGTEDYRTVITGGGAAISGECSCPAFEDWGFCKHMVATVLAANSAGSDGLCESAGALGRIREHLRGRSVDALVDLLMERAERDMDLFRRLDMAAAAASGDDETLEPRLRKAVDAATRTGGYIHYREVSDWAASVETVLEGIADLIPAGRADMALTLVERALARIERAIEEVDDSDGHCSELLDRAREIHLEACRAARPDPVKLARDLFHRELNDGYGVFEDTAARYADILGRKGQAEFRSLAAEAWEALPPLTGGGREQHDRSYGYSRLRNMLDFFAEREGDLEMRIALRAKDLSSPWNYFTLADFCREHGREEEALRHAEEGLWLFEDQRTDERLVFLTADLLCKAGRKEDALTCLWRAFEKQPGGELYKRLRKLGGAKARDRAIAHLETRLSGEKRGHWYSPAGLLISILMKEKRFEAAWDAAGRYGAPGGQLLELARASEKTHTELALKVYEREVESLVNRGGNHAYREAARLIARMASLRPRAEHAAFVLDVKKRHGRKRNFMKLLD